MGPEGLGYLSAALRTVTCGDGLPAAYTRRDSSGLSCRSVGCQLRGDEWQLRFLNLTAKTKNQTFLSKTS